MAEISAATAAANVISERTPHPFTPVARQRTIEPTGPRVKFDRSAFEGSIIGLPATGPGERSVVPGVGPEAKVEFSSEVVSGLRDFATTYVDKLIELQRTPITIAGVRTTIYEAMKNQQAGIGLNYQEDEAMLAAFSKVEDGQRISKSPDEINSMILEHPLMLQNLMAVAERYARDSLAALGIRAEMARPGNRTNADSLRRSVDLPIDQGRLREGYNRLNEWARRPEEQGGRAGDRSNIATVARGLGPWAAAGGLLGALGGTVGGPVGMVGGAALGSSAVSAIATGVGRLTREGPRLVLTDDQDLLNQAQRPGEQLRATHLIGIDPAHPELSTRGGEKVEAEAIRIIYLRAMYMTDLGVPPQRLDALSDQFLNSPGQRPEEIDNKITADIQRRFEELGGRAPGVTIDAARDIYRRAQEGALMDRFAQVMRENRPRENVGRLLTNAINTRQEGGTALQSRKKEATEEQQRLQQEKTVLGSTLEAATNYRNKVVEAEASRKTLENTLATMSAGRPAPLTTEAAINEMREAVSNPGGAASITIVLENGRTLLIQNLASRENAADQDLEVEYGRIAGMNPMPKESAANFEARQTRAREVADRNYARRMEPINREREQMEQAIARMQLLSQNTRNIGDQTLSSTEVVTGAEELMVISKSENTLANFGVPQATIDSGDYSAILTEIHNAYTANPANGWPESEDNTPENRLLIRRAIIQARANQLERAGVTNSATVEPHFTAARNLGFTTEQLALLDIDELETRSGRLNPAGTATPRPELEDAQKWAREQLRYVQDSIRQENTNVQTAENAQARRLRNVDMSTEIAQLTMVRDIYENRDQVKTRAAQAYFLPEQRAGLEDVGHVARGANGYTAAEQASGLPRNVLEVLNILTNYQNAPDRNGAFQQIWANLGSNPDAILLPRLRNAFGLPGANIDSFARRLRGQIRTGTTVASDFGRAAGDNAVNEFVQWGLSIST